MNTFKTVFPYRVYTELSYDITVGIHENIFDGLSDGERIGRGWSVICDNNRLISSDNRLLIKYVAESRKPDAITVSKIYRERVETIIAEGREVSDELHKEIMTQAENEVIKYAPISSSTVFILIDPSKGLLYCGGGTVKKCEDALGFLRKSINGLSVEPVEFGGDEPGIMARFLSDDRNKHPLPENLIIALAGDVLATAYDDASIKCKFSGIDLNDDDVKSVLSTMGVRSVEMNLIQKNDGMPIDFKSRFILQLPMSGNIQLKRFNYLSSADEEFKRLNEGYEGYLDAQHEYAAEMLIVGRYCHEIITTLHKFFLGEDDDEEIG